MVFLVEKFYNKEIFEMRIFIKDLCTSGEILEVRFYHMITTENMCA